MNQLLFPEEIKTKKKTKLHKKKSSRFLGYRISKISLYSR